MANTVSDIIPDDWFNRCIQQESGGDPRIKAASSTATGLGQFLNKTWTGVVRKHEPDWAEGLDDEDLLPLRKDGSKNIEMLGRFWEDNYRTLGGKPTLGDMYLAHFSGAGTARKIRNAPAEQPVVDIVGPKVIKANPYWEGLTCAQARQWAADKMRKAKPKQDWVSKFYEPPADEDEPEAPTRDDITDAADEVDLDGEQTALIKDIQNKLVNMGYNEIGLVDGNDQGGSEGAMAAFLRDRGIVRLPKFNAANIAEVRKAYAEVPRFKRAIAPERENATAKDLAPNNETIRTTGRNEKVGIFGAIATFFAAAINAVGDYFTSVWDKLYYVRKIFKAVPIEMWFVIGIAICLFIWWNARRGKADTVEAFNTRRLLR